MSDTKAPQSPWAKVIAGMSGGAIEALVLQPLDVMKTRLQLDKTKKYSGMINCGVSIYHKEGASALYKGLAPFVTHLTVKYALRFGTFGYMKDMFGKSTSSTFLAGLFAGLVEATMIVTPFEVVKTRLQQQEGTRNLKYTGAIKTAVLIVKEEGLSALWRGVVPTMFRNGSNSAFNFLTFSLLSTHWIGKRENDGLNIPMWKSAVAGFIAASVGPCCNCPMDVVKTRLMAQIVLPGMTPKYKGFISTLKLIAHEEGVAALWKGLGPRLARVAPGQAVTWTVVTQVMYFMEHGL